MTPPDATRPAYELVELLGEGGMGRVYRAVHRPTGLELAIKTLRPELATEKGRRLLLREAAAAGRLEHPHIVRLLDITRDAGDRPALVMELVRGTDLSKWLDAWPGWARVRAALVETLDALATAHGMGIVHRDLKPENLLLDEHGRVKVSDFGVAEVQDPREERAAEHHTAGTPLYMAPEQLDPNGDIGPWTDLYAIGVILYEILCGRPPIVAETLQQMLLRKLVGIPADPLPLRKGLELPPELESLVRRLLASEPRARPRFAREVARTLLPIELREAAVVASPAAKRAENGVSGVDATQALPGSTREQSEAEIDVALAMTITGEEADAERIIARHPTRPPRTDIRTLPAPPSPSTGTSMARLRRPMLVGRAREREIIEDAIDRVCVDGGVRVATLIGSAGTGKSALAQWGLAEVERSGRMERSATGYDLEGAAVTAGLRHVARRLVGHSFEWLKTSSGTLPFDREQMQRWLTGSADASLGSGGAAALAEAAVVAVSAVRPVYLWLDDAGWSRDGALDLVERLLRRTDVNALVVLTLQSGTAVHPSVRGALERIASNERAMQLEIGPLDDSAKRELLASVVQIAPDLEPAVAARLEDAPLMLLTRVYSWLEEGALVPGPLGHTLAEGIDVDRLFSTHAAESAVASRVDRLIASFERDAADAESTLIVAALLGIVFEERVLVDALEHAFGKANDSGPILDRALLRGLLRPEQGTSELRFDHGLVQRALLARLERHPEREKLIRATNDALGRAYESTRAGVSERRAELYRQMGDLPAAVGSLLEVAHAHARRSEFDLARSIIATAREWMDAAAVPEVSSPRGRTLMEEAEIFFFESAYASSALCIRRAMTLLERAGDRQALAAARNIESGIYYYQDRLVDAERVARAVATDPSASPAARSHAWHRLNQIATLAGDFDEALDCMLRSAKAGRRSGEGWRRRIQHVNIAEHTIASGRHRHRAKRHLRAALASARLAGDQVTLAEATNSELWLAWVEGNLDEVRTIVGRRLPEAVARGDNWRETLLRVYSTLLALATDAGDDAISTEVEALLASFARSPHDDPASRWGLWRIGALLEESGRADLATRVKTAYEARAAALTRGLGRPIWDPSTLGRLLPD